MYFTIIDLYIAYGLHYPVLPFFDDYFVPRIQAFHILPVPLLEPHIIVRLVAHGGDLYYAYLSIQDFEVKGTTNNFFMSRQPTPVLSVLKDPHLVRLTFCTILTFFFLARLVLLSSAWKTI